MSDLLLRKHFGALRPVNEAGEELIRSIPNGDVVKAKISRPRNAQHHRLFFALLQTVFENQSRYQTLEHLLAAVKVATGHADLMVMRDGKEVYVPRSISFAKMDQTAFSQFFDRVCDWLVKDVLPNTPSEDLKREVLELIGDKAA